MKSPLKFRSAFTLTELLVVMAIISLLTTLSIPAVSSMAAGGKMNQTVVDVAGTLDQARQYAIAQNTYVWVAFNQNVDGQNVDQLSMAVLASLDGTDPNPWNAYGAVPNSQLGLISKVRTFSQCKLRDAGTFGPSTVPSLSSLPIAGTANNPSEAATFSVRLPGASSTATFSHVIQFTPDGVARNNAGPIDSIEFALQPSRVTSSADANNVAVFRLNGLTGQTLVYRP